MVSNRSTHHIKLTASGKVVLGKVFKQKNLLCKQQSEGCQFLFNHSNENMNMAVFFCRLSQNTILECAIFKLLPFIQNKLKLHHIKM